MENYLTQITNYLLTQSWQIAVLVAVIAAVTLALKNRSAHVRYLLWLIVLAKCLVPPLVTIPLAILPQDKMPEPTLISSGEMPAVNAEMADTVTSEPIALHSLPVTSPTIMERLARVTARQWLGFGWIVGVAAFLLFAFVKALRTNFWLWRQRKLLSAKLQTGIENLFSGLGIKALPKVWLIEGIGQPFVWGLLRGSIYLPANFVKVDTAEHRKGVLGHELGHIVRFDAAVNILQIIGQAVFWFHPFVWWANKKIRAEREKCCDEMAIARLGAKAKDYSSAIVNILISEYESIRPVPSLAIVGPVKNIEERIKTMMRPGKKFYKRPSLIAATVISLLALLIVPTALVLTARAEFKAVSQENKEASKSLWESALKGDAEQLRLSIRRGGNVNHKGAFDFTALHYAARFGHREVAIVLISNGADVNAQTKQGNTPLHEAVRRGDEQIVKLLIKSGADVNIKNKEEYRPVNVAMTGLTGIDAAKRQDLVTLLVKADSKIPPVHLAAFMGDLEKLKDYFNDDKNIDERDELGHTALHMVAAVNDKDIAEFLTSKGAAVQAKDRFGNTPLHYAALYGYNDMVKFLIIRGADINIRNSSNETPLHTAAMRGHKDAVEVFVEHGADVNVKSGSWTPLHYATDARSKDTAEFLISKGAYIDVKDNDGRTPLHWAAHQGYPAAVQLLIEKGADVNLKDNKGFTPLLLAKEYRDKEHQRIVELLRKHGAKEDPSAEEEKKQPTKSLHEAAADGDIEQVKSLISKGADVNEKDKSRKTALHCASEKGHAEVAKFLISQGAYVNAASWDGMTPLHYAAMSGGKQTVELLLSKGAYLNVKQRYGRTPLFKAMTSTAAGRKEVVELLLVKGAKVPALHLAAYMADIEKARKCLQDGMDINSQEDFCCTALHAAANSGKKDIVEFLISKGANVDAKDLSSLTPLYYAAMQDYEDIADLLLAKGADVNAKDKNGYFTLLYYAIWDSSKDAINLLISKGANVNVKDEHGYTPLVYAIWDNDKDMVELLINKGADVNVEDNDGYTPYYWAVIDASKDLVELLTVKGATPISTIHLAARAGDLAKVKRFIEEGTDVNAKDKGGETPLFSAVLADNNDVAKFLIANGADINAKNKNGQIPLHLAANRGHKDGVELLIAKGADVNAKDYQGRTPLHFVFFSGRMDVAKLLIAKGADVNVRITAGPLVGLTPLHFAISGHTEVVELLIAKGADINAKKNNGQTPLHAACLRGQKDVVELLIAKDADVNAKDNEGQTALSLAKEQGHEEIVELLRKLGAKD